VGILILALLGLPLGSAVCPLKASTTVDIIAPLFPFVNTQKRIFFFFSLLFSGLGVLSN
jgi:hypothetical protein